MGGTANNDNWAVRVQESMETTNDIIPASSSLADIAPSPFGLRICSLENDDSLEGSPHRLFYVSKQAALIRDPEEHEMNGVGVRPGWYIIGEQGRFYVEVKVVNEADLARPWEDGVSVSLTIDGQDTNDGRLFRKAGKSFRKGQCSRFNGFAKSVVGAIGTLVCTSRIDAFLFETISDASEDKTYWPTDTGTISMHLSAGKVSKVGNFIRSDAKKYEYPKHLTVSEKEVAKEGRAVRAGRSGLMKTETRNSSCLLIAQRELEAERITVHVRSRSWLHSRRIIDDDDQPFKQVDFVEAQNEFSGSGVRKSVQVLRNIVNDVEIPRKKRKAVKKEKGLLDGASQEEAVDVIELS